ncbi:MAG: pyridine nucleotide-disulfide oxidoreductase [Candidatus Sericytochromatia bacterium]|nr:MAG: pyridine nucleotide-disulfide oxidoreductase [Candidatus Sericytochromatia bacterium]
MLEKSQTILVIGAGPAGLYASGKLTEAGKNVILLNRDIKYGGLAEYGIFVSKHKMKEGIRKQFRKILANENLEYFGNVTVGKNSNVTLEELKNIGFSAYLITAGAQGTKNIGIEGEDAKGVIHAKDLVYHYNHLPPFSEREFEIGNKVAIIGVGNVMVDIAHWLVHYKKVKEVIAIARRGPNERAYTDKEIKAIAYNMDTELVRRELERIRENLESLGQNIEETFKNLIKECSEKYYEEDSPTKFYFKFLSSPKRILKDNNNKVIGLELEENILIEKDGKLVSKGTGKTYTIDLDNVIFAIGDNVDSSLGLSVNKWGEFIKNPNQYEDDPNRNLYELYDEENKKVLEGFFVAGWSRKASDGLVGIARKDGETAAKYILDYLKNKPIEEDNKLSKLLDLFTQKGVEYVTKKDIELLEKLEAEEAKKRNLEFYKFDYNKEMLDLIKSNR